MGDSGSRPIPRRKGDDGSSVSSTGGASWVTGGVAARGEVSEVSDEALGDCRYGPEITGREPTRGDAERLKSSVNDGFFMRLGDDTGDAGVPDRGGSCSMEWFCVDKDGTERFEPKGVGGVLVVGNWTGPLTGLRGFGEMGIGIQDDTSSSSPSEGAPSVHGFVGTLSCGFGRLSKEGATEEVDGVIKDSADDEKGGDEAWPLKGGIRSEPLNDSFCVEADSAREPLRERPGPKLDTSSLLDKPSISDMSALFDAVSCSRLGRLISRTGPSSGDSDSQMLSVSHRTLSRGGFMFRLGRNTRSKLLSGILVSLLALSVALMRSTTVRSTSLFSAGNCAMRDRRTFVSGFDAGRMPVSLGIANVESEGGLRRPGCLRGSDGPLLAANSAASLVLASAS